MTWKGMFKMNVKLRAAATALLLLGSPALTSAGESGPWRFDYANDIGYMAGSMDYDIGGIVTDGGSVSRDNDPLSKLEFPFNVFMLSVRGGVTYSDLVETRLDYSRNINDPRTRMKDSDWTDNDNPSLKTIYSESSAALNASLLDASVRIWAVKKRDAGGNVTAAFGPGAGYYYQNLHWDAGNGEQWYPSDPTRPHDKFRGLAITYDAKIFAPYVALYGKLNVARLLLEGDLGWCFVTTQEVDDHVIRDKISRTHGTGHGIKANLSAKYFAGKDFYLQSRLGLFSFAVKGNQYQDFGGGYILTIEDKTRSEQFSFSLGAGYRF